MPGISVSRIPIPFNKGGFSYSSYWATRNPYFALPTTGVSLMVGQEVTIYGDTLIAVEIDNPLVVTYTCDIGTQVGNNLVITPEAGDIGDHSLRMVFKNGGYTIEDKTIAITVYPEQSIAGKSILMIGDSTLAGDLDEIGATINTTLPGETITFLGTKDSAPYLNEGISGFSFAAFATNALSPFVKEGSLNISAYFTDNSIATPDVVHIRLGVNDIYGLCDEEIDDADINTIIGHADDLIDGFLAFDPYLKIIIALPTLCTNSAAVWDTDYNPPYDQDRFITYTHRLWVAMTAKYANGSYNRRVDMSYEAIGVNRAAGHLNALHFNSVGNAQLGVGCAMYINNTSPDFLTVTADGDGSGVATLHIGVSGSTVTLQMVGNAKFYSDAAGTADESDTWEIPLGLVYTRYVRCASGVTRMKFSDPSKINLWGRTSQSGWTTPPNSPVLGGSITPFVNMTVLRINGKTALRGILEKQTGLTFIYIDYANQIIGDIGQNDLTNGVVSFFYFGNTVRLSKYTAGATWGDATIRILAETGYGYSSTEIDNMLIDMANSASGPTGKTITLTGANAARTSASDAAKATLEGRGCTVTTN